MNCKVLTPESQAMILSALIDSHTRIIVQSVCDAVETGRPRQEDPLLDRLELAIAALS